MIRIVQKKPKRAAAGLSVVQRLSRHNRRSFGGQTMVEFPFILPILLILMLGVIQMVLVGGPRSPSMKPRWLPRAMPR